MTFEWIKGVLRTVFDSPVGDFVYPATVIVAGATLADPVTKSPIEYPLDLAKSLLGKVL